MKIRNVKHKGLKRYFEADDASGLPPQSIVKVNDIISFLLAMSDESELRIATSWKPHQLGGDRKGTWALHVTKNWRITFKIDKDEIEVIDLNYEDYH